MPIMAYQSRPQINVDANLVRISILVPALLSSAAAYFAFHDSFDLSVIYAYLRLTGWGMLGCFLCSFGASTAHHFFPLAATRWLLQNRKYFGLGFAVFITFHFYGLYLKMAYDPPFFFQDLTIPEFVLGVVAIFFTLAMTFTSSAGMQKKIGVDRWATLHTWGGNGILFAFWITYSDHGLSQFPIFLALNILIILRCLRRLQDLARQGRREITSVILTTFVVLTVGAAGFFFYQQTANRGGPAVQRDHLYGMRDYFPLTDGKVLTYRLTVNGKAAGRRSLRIRAVEPVYGRPAFRIETAGNSSVTVGMDNYGIRLYDLTLPRRVFTFDPPGIFLPHLYLYEEKTFETRLYPQGDPPADAAARLQYSAFRLAAKESVLVAGRKFADCLRVTYTRRTADGHGLERITQGVLWLAPGIGRIKEERSLEVRDGNGAVLRQRQEEWEWVDAPPIRW